MAESRPRTRRGRVTILAGGVGAARLLRGLSARIEPERLTVVVNTGDDESFFGLHVSPDLDTITYTLADRVDRGQGWGLAGDTFRCLDGLSTFYSAAWFRLGDTDLATHLYRTDALRAGHSLSRVTTHIAACLRVRARILPMSDDSVRTMVTVRNVGALPFQEYLVKRRAGGAVEAIRFRGIRAARPAPGVLAAIRQAHAVIIPPSNPFVSILPILALPGVRAALRRVRSRVTAVSPLVRGRPIKGPLDRMLRGLGHEVSAVGVAALYRDIASRFILDTADAALAPRIAALGMEPVITDTIMHTPARSAALAAVVLRPLTGPAGPRRTDRHPADIRVPSRA